MSYAPAQEVVVDNDAGTPGYVEMGTWTTTSNSTAGYASGSYRFTRSTSPFSTATWRPQLLSAGTYEVSAIFRRAGDRSSAVPYSVQHLDGISTRAVDQTGSFSGDLGEVSLGTYRFAAGNAGTVTMTNAPGGSLVFIADAVRFRPDPPPQFGILRIAPLYPQAGSSFVALSSVSDNGPLGPVRVFYSAVPSGIQGSVVASDQGLTDDGAAGDGLYGGILPGFPHGDSVTLSFQAQDSFGAVTDGTSSTISIGVTASFQVRINELMASNGGSSFDADFGDSGDWVELRNAGPDVADLTSHTLTDNPAEPYKWRFPAGTSIPAGGFLRVWCDDANLTDNDIHTNFRLSASGEALVLTNAITSTVVDSVSFPPLGTDETYARIPDQTGAFAITIVPTPNAANFLGVRGGPPQFSRPSGLTTSSLSVSISAPGATEVRYTTTGAEPTTTSTLYTSPVVVTSTTALRARAWYTTAAPSLVATASYFFIQEADRSIPVMNLVMDPADLFDPVRGIYANFNARGDAWERPGYAMFMNSDGSQLHESPVGVRINGGSSRGLAKKSFRLYLRNSYGRSFWSLPWLTRTSSPSFTNLVLRGNNNDGILNASVTQLNQVAFFRDQIARDWSGQTGNLGVDGFFFALYINGQYWGLYNACERVTDDYMQSKVGGSNWDVTKGTWNSTLKYHTEAIDGSLAAWNSFIAWVDANDLATTTAYAQLQQRIELIPFLRYMALNIALQNEDWPMNNWIATRRNDDPLARWTFHENDAEWALGLRPQGYQSDTMTWAQGTNFMLSTGHNNTIAPLSKLFNGNDLQANRVFNINGILDNPQGRSDFISAMEEILNFELVPEKAIAEVNAYANLIQTEVPRESARWASNMATSAAAFNAQWPVAVNNIRTFLNNRPAFVRNLMISKFSIPGTRIVTFTAQGSGNGQMQIYGRNVQLPWSGVFFDGSQLQLSALPNTGSSFLQWTGALSSSSPSVTLPISVGSATTVTLQFGPATVNPLPNDVIFNEYWVNDESTSYPGIGRIEGDWLELLVVRPLLDLRGWRVSNNPTRTTQSTIDDGDGSLVFPNHPQLASLPSGTVILVVTSSNTTNALTFPTDDLDPSDRRLVLYRGNATLSETADPGFGIRTSNEALSLLAPGPTAAFVDDVLIDFIAEGSTVTPTGFLGTATSVAWPTPFTGIGNDDGSIFTNSSGSGFINDNGAASGLGDGTPGPGGWIVDPPSTLSGDNPVGGPNILTPGFPNTGQNITPLTQASVGDWMLH